MKKLKDFFNIIYFGFLFLFILTLIILSLSSIILLNYPLILLIILLLILPLVPKIIKINYKDMGIELASKKELEELEKKGDDVLSDEEVEKGEENYSEIDYLIKELLDIGEYNYHLGLATMRLRLEQLVRDYFIKNLLKGRKKSREPGLGYNLRQMSKKIYDANLIDKNAYELLRDLLKIFNKAVHGFEISYENGEIIYENGIKIIIYFYKKNLEKNKNYSLFSLK